MGGDDEPPGRKNRFRKTTMQEKNEATIKEIEAKEEIAKNKRREAKQNLEAKLIKKDTRKATEKEKEKETEKQQEVEEKSKQNVNEINSKIDKLGETIVGALKDEIRGGLNTIADSIAEAIKNAMASQSQTNNEPLATQNIIDDAIKAHERLNRAQSPPIQPDRRIDPNQQTEMRNEYPELPEKPPTRIPTIYPSITREELVKTVNSLIIRINMMEDTIQSNKWKNKPNIQPNIQSPKYLPGLNIDCQGNQCMEQTESENIPLDYTKVKTARKFKEPRPELPHHVNKSISKELKDHVKEQRNKGTKSRQQQEEMEPRTKDQKVREMLNKQSLIIGVAPISREHIEKVEKTMLQRGALDEREPREERRQRTIKSVLKNWAFQHLKITDKEWSSIQLEEIQQTYSEDSNILFLKCKSAIDAMKITSRAHNLPTDNSGNGPRLVQFIDKRARARHRAFQLVAKTLRDEATAKGQRIQTNLRTGRTDFLLRIRQLGDTTPWSDTPPIKIDQRLPGFEIGIFKDIFNLSYSSSEEEEDQAMEESPNDQEEMNRIQSDIENENSEKKRDRMSSEEEEEKTTKKTKIKSTPYPKGRLPESQTESSDEESSRNSQTPKVPMPVTRNQRKIFNTPTNQESLNKTLVDETPATWNQMSESDFEDNENKVIKETPLNKAINKDNA